MREHPLDLLRALGGNRSSDQVTWRDARGHLCCAPARPLPLELLG